MWTHGCTTQCSPLQIEHLDIMVYVRMQWCPKRFVDGLSSAPLPLRRHIPCPDARSHEHQDKPWEAIPFVLMQQFITSGMSHHIGVVWEVDSYFALSWQFVVLCALCPHVWTFLDFVRDLMIRMMTPDWASVSHTFAVCVRVGVLRGVLVIDILRCLTDR